MKKALWLDTETTGLDPTKHGLVQLAMLMDIDGNVEDELLIDIQPFENDIVIWEHDGKQEPLTYEDAIYYPKILNELTLNPSMIPLAMIIDFCAPCEAYADIITFLNKHIDKYDKADKAYLGGYNVKFDAGFISEFFKKMGDNYLGSFINWKCLDPLYRLWEMDYRGDVALENYKLETVCKHFGIEISAHNAMSDIKATRELWYRLELGNE